MAEESRLTGRLRRFVQVGTGVGGFAARLAGERLMGRPHEAGARAAELASALGGMKGPIMKVAQILATIPDLVPPEYAAELSKLQMHAPPMGPSFVRRRMKSELGADWQRRFASFEPSAAAAASLGQVHRAVHRDGRALAVKLQYPDMLSAVEADLAQLQVLFAVYRRLDSAIDPSEIGAELSARLREELDYEREAAHMRLYRAALADRPEIRVPELVEELSTRRLLTMSWEEGDPLLAHKGDPLAARNEIAQALFRAWWAPFARLGVIHGDPHLGNYSVRHDGEAVVNLLDYGCIRIFPPRFVEGVVALYTALKTQDRDLAVHAYETWGFSGLSNELIDALQIWADFIYGPLLDDRVRTIADKVTPAEYGRREAFIVHQKLKTHGPVKVPREFVFMDRAAIGLGAVFLHLEARLNFHRLFEEALAEFDAKKVAARQKKAFAEARLTLPEDVAAALAPRAK
ncbi:MAG: AarF/ABC1/UbiB kinase family protein [Alphaproteobacteria bacterium]|nr:AarF/ABC1/UbiB kinase family protein [Alphaproteobacteria bacterium]